MHTGAFHSRLRGAISLVVLVAGTLVLGVGVTSALAPGQPTGVPDAAFHAVVLPSGSGPAVADAPVPTADLGRIAEPAPTPASRPARPQPSIPLAPLVVVSREPAASGPSSASSTGHVLSGPASWYCRAGVSPCTVGHPDTSGFDAYAAAGPKLRAAIGPDWRGRIVSVDGIAVKLVDWCQCYKGEPNEKLLDLYYDVFARTQSAVTIRW